MSSVSPVEHFVTLFNTSYLPAGLCLYRSLREQAGPFHLWVLCMDTTVEACLRELGLPDVSLIAIGEVETEALLAVKSGRTAGEYCWTLTPFAPEFVMRRAPSVERVTYVDADLYFFDDPRILLKELESSGAHVLITEHAYAPQYDKTPKSGIYCVQFIPFRNTPEARSVMNWWQDRCLEWCFARYEDGKHGDQMYLDDWTTRFPGKVHVLRQKERTLAPWNAAHFLDRKNARVPVFFHFHSFRVVSDRKMRWHWGYHVGENADRYYEKYFLEMCNALALTQARWKLLPTLRDVETIRQGIAKCYYLLRGSAKYSDYSLDR
jgi:hypothetical protein